MSELREPEPIEISFSLSVHNGANVSCRGYSDGYAEASVTGGNGGYNYFGILHQEPCLSALTRTCLDSFPAGNILV